MEKVTFTYRIDAEVSGKFFIAYFYRHESGITDPAGSIASKTFEGAKASAKEELSRLRRERKNELARARRRGDPSHMKNS